MKLLSGLCGKKRVDHKHLANELQRKLDAKEREYKTLKEDHERSMAEIKTELLSLKESSLCDEEINSLRSEVERLQAELNVEQQWNASTLDLERTRSILLAQLMSVQLVYSMEDISRMSLISPENNISNSNDSVFKRVDQRPIKEGIGETDNTRNNHSPTSSLPSGYETGSCKSTISDDGKAGTPDLDPCFENDTSLKEQRRQAHISRSYSDSSQVCSPLLTKLRSPYSPRRNQLLENLLESQLHGIGIDTINLQDSSSLSVGQTVNELQKEISHLKSSVDSEVVEVFVKIFGEDPGRRHEDGQVSKRQLYSHAALQLTAQSADKTSRFTIHDLDQALNLVLLDLALIGCILALAQHDKRNVRDTNGDQQLDATDLHERQERADELSNLSVEICEENEMQRRIRKRKSFFRRLIICGRADGFSKKTSKKSRT